MYLCTESTRNIQSCWTVVCSSGQNQKTLEINDIRKLSPKLRLSSISLDLDLMARDDITIVDWKAKEDQYTDASPVLGR